MSRFAALSSEVEQRVVLAIRNGCETECAVADAIEAVELRISTVADFSALSDLAFEVAGGAVSLSAGARARTEIRDSEPAVAQFGATVDFSRC